MADMLDIEGLYVTRRRSDTAPDTRPRSTADLPASAAPPTTGADDDDRRAAVSTERPVITEPPPGTPPVTQARAPLPPMSDHPATTMAKGRRRRSMSDPLSVTVHHHRGPIGLRLLSKLGNFLSRSKTAGSSRVYSSAMTSDPLPTWSLRPLRADITAAFSGPNGGLVNCRASPSGDHDHDHDHDTTNDELSSSGSSRNDRDNGSPDIGDTDSVHQCVETNERADNCPLRWRLRTDTAYGMSVSLYEYKNSQKHECTGDPIADVFAIRTTSNSCVMAVADGVGWGQGSRRAARCAVKGAMEHTWNTLYGQECPSEHITTADVFKCLRGAIDEAQGLIIDQNGSLTTLCLAVVADVTGTGTGTGTGDSRALCVASVGDSLAFVFSRQRGVREVTAGIRDYDLHRNIRFCDGALGPCFGEEPDLGNLTFALTSVEAGDLVYLTSDGVSDNFDPVVAGEAVAHASFKSGRSRVEVVHSDRLAEGRGRLSTLRALSPRERQVAMTEAMGRVIGDATLPDEGCSSASSLCSKLLQHAVNLSQGKRQAYEATNDILDTCEREKLASASLRTGKDALYQHARALPGKLDHATVVAYLVGGAVATSAGSPGASATEEQSSCLDVSVGNEQSKAQISLID